MAADEREKWQALGVKEVREVWARNFEAEISNLMLSVGAAGGARAIVALDTEFPGFLYETPRTGGKETKYGALRSNVDKLSPIQLGIAVAGAEGAVRGVWCFNMCFDVDVDLHTEESVNFLRRAGINFVRHKKEGISSVDFGRRLRCPLLVGPLAPLWLTFSGDYDLGYLLKVLTIGTQLPGAVALFDGMVSGYMPRRFDLQDMLTQGSLESLGRKFGIRRHGSAHTAGSDALLTLELYLKARENVWLSSGERAPWGADASGMWNDNTWDSEWSSEASDWNSNTWHSPSHTSEQNHGFNDPRTSQTAWLW
mmetsp:Transcript_6777/g.16989  ORF Transcript_6777/g.16989 Transcript_6777/m.16989 type:complete len:310 (-) Transcript_6777:370-1299(-)